MACPLCTHWFSGTSAPVATVFLLPNMSLPTTSGVLHKKVFVCLALHALWWIVLTLWIFVPTVPSVTASC
jgi:hypothetical protein